MIVGDIGLVYDFMFGSYGVIGVVWFFFGRSIEYFWTVMRRIEIKNHDFVSD